MCSIRGCDNKFSGSLFLKKHEQFNKWKSFLNEKIKSSVVCGSHLLREINIHFFKTCVESLRKFSNLLTLYNSLLFSRPYHY